MKKQKGEELDGMVQKYVQAIRNAGTPIGTSVVMAAAQGIVKAYAPFLKMGLHLNHKELGSISALKNWLHKT